MNLPELPDYRVEKLIGEGPFGLVFRCTYQEQEQRAIKYLKAQAVNTGLLNSCFRGLSGRDKHPGLAEVYDHNFVTHPFHYILPLYGWRDAETDQWVSNTLDQYLGKLELEDAHQIVEQLADALCYLHRCDVIHAGLKPSNIFVTGKNERGLQVKIADWGQGYVTGLQYLEMGNLGFYAAPEQLDNGNPASGAGKRWDVYAFGVVAYQLLAGRLPRLEEKFQEHLGREFDHVPATAFGSILEYPERYVDWIVEEDDIEWPGMPKSDLDAKRREIITRCLSVDPRDRYADMRDVENALAMADQELSVVRLEKLAKKSEEKVQSRLRRWKTTAMGTVGLFLGGAVLAGVLFAKWESAEGFFKRRQIEPAKVEEVPQETSDADFEELGAKLSAATAIAEEKDAEIRAREAAKEKLAEQMRQQMRQSKELIRESQKNGDRFFEMVLENRNSDVPEYEEERLARLSEARSFYQSLLAVYADEPEFIDASAKAARYLGEIYLELGNFNGAGEYFSLAEKKLRRIDQAKPGQNEVQRDLAMVRKRQGKLLYHRRDMEPALLALHESNQLWRHIHETNPADRRAVMEVGENFLMEADIRKDIQDAEGRRMVISSAMETFVALQEAAPDQHRVIGGLAKSTELSARFLEEKSQDDESLETYQQAADLFGRAIQLNAAVDEYHIGLAENLAAIALLEDDAEKLQEAAKVLSEVASAPDNRSNGALQKALSDCYGRLAEQQRDGGNTAEAIKWEQQAAGILQVALAEMKGKESSALVRFALAERKCHLAELQGDVKNFAESGKTLTEALILLTALLEAEPANPAFRRQYALAQGQIGYATQQVGNHTEARKHYEAARDHWEAFASAFPDDDQAAEAVEWTKRQLSALP